MVRCQAEAPRITPPTQLSPNQNVHREYESPDGADDILYVYCTVGIEPTATDAQYAYSGVRLGTKIGFGMGGGDKVQEVERNDLWQWGEHSRCVLLQSSGKQVGNVFMARKGRRYFVLVLVGVYFDNPEVIHELLDPMLQRLQNYEG